MPLLDEANFVIGLARGAGRLAMEHFGRAERLTKTHAAASAEAVTEADRAVQRFIVAGLRRRFRSDGIVGEENDRGDAITFECPNPAGRVWVIDPIDGTNNFVAGLPIFAVSIGLMERGRPILGVVYDVCRDSVIWAAAGQGAWRDTQRVRAATTPLDDSSLIMITSNLLDASGRLPPWVLRLVGQTRWKLRCIGSAALEAAMVGTGIAHAAITVNGKLWDCAAAAAVVLEAGGRITDLSGCDVFPFDLAGYAGAKVPFLAAAPSAAAPLIHELNLPEADTRSDAGFSSPDEARSDQTRTF